MIEEIIKNNNLIGEFMELQQLPNDEPDTLTIVAQSKRNALRSEHLELKYHESWDWLMPVIEKICRIRVGDGVELVDYSYPRTFGMLNAETGKIMVRLNGHILFEADTLIEAAWLAAVDFIKMQGV